MTPRGVRFVLAMASTGWSPLATAGPCVAHEGSVSSAPDLALAHLAAGASAAEMNDLLRDVVSAMRCRGESGVLLPAEAAAVHVAAGIARSADDSPAGTAASQAALLAARSLVPWLPPAIGSASWLASVFEASMPSPPRVSPPLAADFQLIVDGSWTDVYDPDRAAVVQLLLHSPGKRAEPIEWKVVATDYVWDGAGVVKFLQDHGASPVPEAPKAKPAKMDTKPTSTPTTEPSAGPLPPTQPPGP